MPTSNNIDNVCQCKCVIYDSDHNRVSHTMLWVPAKLAEKGRRLRIVGQGEVYTVEQVYMTRLRETVEAEQKQNIRMAGGSTNNLLKQELVREDDWCFYD